MLETVPPAKAAKPVLAPLILHARAAAKVLNMSASKFYELLRDPHNAPPSFHIGRNRYFSVSSLESWIMEQEQRTRCAAAV
jgi:predicted DNA-binding transcriptional regulator AlpA